LGLRGWAGLNIEKPAFYEAPFMVDKTGAISKQWPPETGIQW
jgi:hypothetical protein